MARSKTPPRAAAADIVAAIFHDLQDLSVATTPAVRAVRRRHSAVLAHESPEMILGVANALFDNASRPARLIAREIVATRVDVLRRLNGAIVERWTQGLADWGSIDMYGVTIAGLAWREGRISNGHVMRWARSANRWRRRLALVATVPLNLRARGGSGDTGRTLNVCRTLVDDRDDMVVKALSWALRELAKRDPNGVAHFLADEDARLAARVRREVKTKLETGKKHPTRS